MEVSYTVNNASGRITVALLFRYIEEAFAYTEQLHNNTEGLPCYFYPSKNNAYLELPSEDVYIYWTKKNAARQRAIAADEREDNTENTENDDDDDIELQEPSISNKEVG